MHYADYGHRAQSTPQTEPIAGREAEMALNNAQGVSFAIDDMQRFHRFLLLGTDGGTFYVGERELTKQNLAVLERLLESGHGKEAIDAILAVSKAGRAAKNDPALFALARCAAASDVDVRRYALQCLSEVARTGTHLLHYVHYAKQFRGFGRAYKRALASWYTDKEDTALAYQMLKYQQRDGYSQRDLLRQAHPKARTEVRNALYHWAVNGWPDVGLTEHPEPALRQIWAYERAKRLPYAEDVAGLIRRYKLPREAIPSEMLNHAEVWSALLEDMPLEALLRNLATMTRVGLIGHFTNATGLVVQRLLSGEHIRKARLHPIKILAALLTYQSGKGLHGNHTWTPVAQIIEALNQAFYLSFANVTSIGKRILLAVDVSGSMHGTAVNGIPGLSCHTAAAAMAMVTARTEWQQKGDLSVPQYQVIGFDQRVYPLGITPQQRLDDIFKTLSACGGGGTDCALPFTWLRENKVDVDAIITYTDSESWAGAIQPVQALQQYRRQVGHPVRAINVQMAATHVTNLDPNDRESLEVVGFDTAVPEVMAAFIRGEC